MSLPPHPPQDGPEPQAGSPEEAAAPERPEAAMPPRARTLRAAWAILRRHAPVIVTLVLFFAGASALYRLIAPLDLTRVAAQIEATSPLTLLEAFAATALGYAALVGYDWSALRFIGKTAPPAAIGMAGFMGYALGNTIGLAAVSGGAVRYRIYSSLGLDAYDVAAISTFAALSYGVGATLIGLGALAAHPAALGAIVALPHETLRLAAIAGLVVCVLGLGGLSVSGASLRIGRFNLRSPRPPELIRQLCITGMDIGMAALTLHLLLPAGSPPFANLLAVYAVATMAGVASHVPGGVGVFESVVIAALPPSVDTGVAVAALLLFRLVYFMIPFGLALGLLALIELRAAARAAPAPGESAAAPRAIDQMSGAARALTPAAIGAFTLALGLLMMVAGLLPNLHASADDLSALLPLAASKGGPLLASILGALLTVLALALFRRSRLGFRLAFALLCAGAVYSGAVEHDLARAAGFAFGAAILWPCRREFRRNARLTQGMFSARWIALVVAILGCMGMTWRLVHGANAAPDMMWWQVTGSDPSVVAWRAALAAAVALSAALLHAGLRVAAAPPVAPTPEALERAAAILRAHGTGSELRALSGDKALLFSENGAATLSFAVSGGYWIALGAPVGPGEAAEDLAWGFADAARAAGAHPALYGAPERFAPIAVDLGLSLHRLGEEAVVPLGAARPAPGAALARGLAAAEAAGLHARLSTPPHDAALRATLARLDRGRGGRPRGFAFGGFDAPWLARGRVVAVFRGGELVTAATLFDCGGEAFVDRLILPPEAPEGADMLLLSACIGAAEAAGAATLSLGLVPSPAHAARHDAALWAGFAALAFGDRGGAARSALAEAFGAERRPRGLWVRSALTPEAPLREIGAAIAGRAEA